jgi:arylsulfatase A-like enzyme
MPFQKAPLLSLQFWLILLCSSMIYADKQKDFRPNIIIFYVDDLGWQDTPLNNLDEACPYEMPNLMRLAESGMNFTQAYSPAPSCSPSRAGIFTGQHPAKIGLTHVELGARKLGRPSERVVAPYLESHLNLNLFNLADAMKENGYYSGHVGKWHVGLSAEAYRFDFVDQTRGIHRGLKDRTKDFATAKDKSYPLSKKKYPPFSEKKPQGISYPYDQLTESALDFMKESKDKPFFLNLCHWMVHWPVVTRNGELLEYYCDKMGQGFPPKAGDMTLPGQNNPYFAAMVTSVDWSLGRVMSFLQETDDPRNKGKKLIETTYIFFSSDNGGAEKKAKEIISDNAPLKYGKTNPEEGGIRVPMVTAGPSIAAGSQFDGLVNQLDYFPTILKLTHSKISQKNFDELSGLDISQVLSSESSTILDAKGNERKNLFWHYPHGSQMKSAIRQGDFKLYKNYMSESYELYQLYKNGNRQDIEEQNDLVNEAEYASILKELSTELDRLLRENNTEPIHLNPTYSERKKAVALIANSHFDSASRKVTLTLKSSGPAADKAFIIYLNDPKKVIKRHSHEAKNTLIGMRRPAKLTNSSYELSAVIPEAVEVYCFLFIDKNNFQHYSEIFSSK